VNTGTLGQRLANSWLDEHYRTRGNTSSLVYTKAPQIIRAFDEGAVTRSRRGRFPVIFDRERTEEGSHGRQIRPSTFSEHGTRPLRFRASDKRASLLMADGLHYEAPDRLWTGASGNYIRMPFNRCKPARQAGPD
jgi:hypothetical protein